MQQAAKKQRRLEGIEIRPKRPSAEPGPREIWENKEINFKKLDDEDFDEEDVEFTWHAVSQIETNISYLWKYIVNTTSYMDPLKFIVSVSLGPCLSCETTVSALSRKVKISYD